MYVVSFGKNSNISVIPKIDGLQNHLSNNLVFIWDQLSLPFKNKLLL